MIYCRTEFWHISVKQTYLRKEPGLRFSTSKYCQLWYKAYWQAQDTLNGVRVFCFPVCDSNNTVWNKQRLTTSPYLTCVHTCTYVSIAAVLSKLLPAKKSISLIFFNNLQTSVTVIAKLPFLIVISYAKYCQWDNQVHQGLAIPSWSSPTSKVWLCYETEVPACATMGGKLNMMHTRHDNVHL